MTPILRTLLLVAVLAVGIACDAVAILLRSPVWALAGQIPLVALLLWMSHHVEKARAQLGVVARAATAAQAETDKPPLTQDDYAALLRGDETRCRSFTPTRDMCGFYCLRCSRGVKSTWIRHPIWDGPFDGAGSGAVDARLIQWCLRCDGPPPSEAGRPVRLPYLDTEPIALVPELFGRAAFHMLGQRVIPAPALPPRPTHVFMSQAGGTICDVCGYAKDDPRHG